jgi:hypothetical protein
MKGVKSEQDRITITFPYGDAAVGHRTVDKGEAMYPDKIPGDEVGPVGGGETVDGAQRGAGEQMAVEVREMRNIAGAFTVQVILVARQQGEDLRFVNVEFFECGIVEGAKGRSRGKEMLERGRGE